MEESINLSAWLGCNVNQAFNMFTNKEHLQSWLPVVKNVEPKLGGKYEVSVVKKPENKKSKKDKKNTIGCKILAYEPNKFIAFEWKAPDDKSIKDSSKLRSQVAIYFLPMASKKKLKQSFTEVHLILTVWKDKNNGRESKERIEDTWANAFAKLTEYVSELF
ncbi:SRPBCC family protein [[Eubacterium] cellulosolvens]